jgi:diguanylate cyclase (GGDEF)-like protein
MATSDDPAELGRRWAREAQPVSELIALFEAADLSAALMAYAAELQTLYAAEAQRDALTQLGNRAAFEHHLAAESARALRYDRALTIAMLDLDGFKLINDTHGHAVGDSALQQFAALLKASLRQSDQAFRYGGDEFTVLLPETSAAATDRVMMRLRERLAAAGCAYGFSWGVAALPADASEPRELLLLADARLYAQKRERRL